MTFKDILQQNSGTNQTQRYGESEFANRDKKCKIEFFSGTAGASYCKSDIVCNDFLKQYREKGVAYSFLFFNSSNEKICFKAGKNRFILGENEFWLGALNGEFSGICEYQNKHYSGQCVIVSPALSNEIEGFKNLEFNSGMAIKNLGVNLTQKLVLSELLRAKIYDGKMREIFMEAKILQLLYTTFGAQKSSLEPKFSADEVKILNKAHQILLNNLQNPPSIKELARLCATNEFKLKIGFKKHFGTTIYALLANERLSAARQLLAQNDISVKEAAKLVGYASAPHFAKIFKEKFGVLPTQLLREKKFYI